MFKIFKCFVCLFIKIYSAERCRGRRRGRRRGAVQPAGEAGAEAAAAGEAAAPHAGREGFVWIKMDGVSEHSLGVGLG